MRLEPLYRIRFVYTEGWAVEGPEERHFYIAEGRCEGRVEGRYRAANHPLRRNDGTFCPDLQGVIETDDGAVIYHDSRGYGRSYPEGRRQIVAWITHLSSDERYSWLNDAVCPAVGEVRSRADGSGVDLVVDVAELIWETLAD